MTANQPEQPQFLLEALAEDEPGALDAAVATVSALSSLLQPVSVPGPERLLKAVEVLPLRYAPFFDRLAAFWDLPATEVEAIIEGAQKPAAWRKPGLPGLRVIDIEGGPRVKTARVTLAHFAPGMRFPAHRHPGPEALIVLEGSYRDQSGQLVGPGDLHEMAAGTEHWFRVGREGPCVAATVQYGLEFTGTWMKLLVRLFG